MATITVTASSAAQARIPTSVETITVMQTYNRSVSASDTDVFYFENLKIPHQAYITRLEAIHDTSDGQTIYKVGLVGGVAAGGALFGSITTSGTGQLDTLIPAVGIAGYRVSVSDDQPIRFGVIALTQDGAVGASPTGSVSITIVVQYTMVRD